MKKALNMVLVLVICLSLVACGNGAEKVETEIQGTWVRSEDAQTQPHVYLKFQNGSVTRTDNSTDQSINGTYTIDKNGTINITYSDGTTQAFTSYITADGGTTLMDHGTGVYYNKTN